ncbi:MAG: c-type cytochrome [Gammaproteobacteria bacterium]|jgi:cytochrome c553|nr:c-type cytochrome [Gammaproteobacteria bacterium]|tara:strand:+ start:1948 stop:2241 length:294 start_codon:yes stop_codon:yes gene_type:complete
MKKVLFVVAIFSMLSSYSVQAGTGEDMFNALGCAGCHGVGGKSSISTYPSLAGKDADWLVQQLKDFQTGTRQDPTMNAMAPMTAGFEQAIADYLSSQ